MASLAPIIAVALFLQAGVSAEARTPITIGASFRLPIGYAGVDYYWPTEYFTHCGVYAWLESSCYANGADSARQQLSSDLRFVRSHAIASTMRVWISLDQLMEWDQTRGFVGYIPGILKNVDDMLAQFHQYGIHVVLVLYTYNPGNFLNQFHPQALDGLHHAMRSNYLRAVSLFMRHVARNAVDHETAPFIELQNEPYYQLETYFNDPSNLGTFARCGSDGTTDWGCVDRLIIHPWLKDLYRTAHRAAPGFFYSFSDTGRMFEDFRYWRTMFPGNIINEHVYNTTPWLHTSFYAQGMKFKRPWIVTEAGCSTGDIACTYTGNASSGNSGATSVDAWWLNNLDRFGAQSVMLESHVTLWTYPKGPNSQTPTEVGQGSIRTMAEHLGPTLHGSSPAHTARRAERVRRSVTIRTAAQVFRGFDHVRTGVLRLGTALNSSASVIGGSRVTVQRRVYKSAPAALAINLSGGGQASLVERSSKLGEQSRLRFDINVGRDLSFGSVGSIAIGRLTFGTTSSNGSRITLRLAVSGRLRLCGTNMRSRGTCASTSRRLERGRWYRIQIESRHGRARVTIDGHNAAGVAIVNQPVARLSGSAAGLSYAPSSSKVAGTLYVDNILLTS